MMRGIEMTETVWRYYKKLVIGIWVESYNSRDLTNYGHYESKGFCLYSNVFALQL